MPASDKNDDAPPMPVLNSNSGAVLSPPSAYPKRKRRLRRWLVVLGVVVVLFLALTVFVYHRTTAKIHIGPHTTFVTGPLRPDGTVNYVAAFNLLSSKGVTAGNNAAIPLIRIFGASKHVLGEHWRSVLRAMGYTPGRGGSPHYTSLARYLKARPSVEKAMRARPVSREVFLSGRMVFHIWSARAFPFFAAYLHNQRAVLAACRKAAEKPRFFIPLAGPGILTGSGLEWMAFVLTASRELLAQAMLDVSRGKFNAVVPDLRAAQRLAQMIGQRPGLMPWLTANSVMFDVYRAQCTLATDPRIRLPRKLFVRILAHHFHRKLPALSWEINYPERFGILDMLTGIYRSARGENTPFVPQPLGTGGPAKLLPALVNWNWVLRSTNRMFNAEAKGLKVTPLARRFTAGRALRRKENRRFTNSFFSFFQPSVLFRNVICRIIASPYRRATFNHYCMLQQRQYVRVAAALALDHMNTGVFPDTLTHLVPKYLNHAPRDVFTGGPLTYHRTKAGYTITCHWQVTQMNLGKREAAGLGIIYPEKPPRPLNKFGR